MIGTEGCETRMIGCCLLKVLDLSWTAKDHQDSRHLLLTSISVKGAEQRSSRSEIPSSGSIRSCSISVVL